MFYSNYIGGSNGDYGQSIAIDASGNAYITGYTQSTNYPTTSGSYQPILDGRVNALITKLNLSPTTLVNPGSLSLPNKFELMQNYPNPFNPSTVIRFSIPFSSNVKIEVYNILGEKIKELVNEQKSTGNYEVNFNTNGLASGVYFYMIEAKSIDGKNEYRETKKMVFLK